MTWTPPVGVTPLDRRSPTTAREADIQDVLDWLKAHYPGNTVKGITITADDTGNSFRVDSDTRPYKLTATVLPPDILAQVSTALPQLAQAATVAQAIGSSGLVYAGEVAGRTLLGVAQGGSFTTVNQTLPSGRVIQVYQITLNLAADTGVY